MALFSGIETASGVSNTFEYRNEGELRDMHLYLMTATGRTVRVFRSFTLTSRYAPTAGIRYDGEYVYTVPQRELEECS